jgi:hypothetical protein
MKIADSTVPALVMRDYRPAVLRATDWLSLGAAPTFAFMAALTGGLGDGAHEMFCSGATHPSPLSGMVPMYVLMSAFHFVPWLKLISGWRSVAHGSKRYLTHKETDNVDII